MKYKLVTHSKRLLADTLTPVNIYLKVRDVFSGSILLESSDYHGHENSLSFICCDPIASFQVKDEMIEVRFPDHSVKRTSIASREQVLNGLMNSGYHLKPIIFPESILQRDFLGTCL